MTSGSRRMASSRTWLATMNVALRSASRSSVAFERRVRASRSSVAFERRGIGGEADLDVPLRGLRSALGTGTPYTTVRGNDHEACARAQPCGHLAVLPLEGRLRIGCTGKGAIAQVPQPLLPHGLLARGVPLEGGKCTLFACARADDQPALPSLGQVLGPAPAGALPVVAVLPADGFLAYHPRGHGRRLRHPTHPGDLGSVQRAQGGFAVESAVGHLPPAVSPLSRRCRVRSATTWGPPGGDGLGHWRSRCVACGSGARPLPR